MRNNSLIILLGLLLLVTACEEDIEVLGDYGSKPIVYCLLNPDDSIHYLRISESFITTGDPDEFVIDSDSLILHEDFYAYIEEEKPGRTGDITYFSPAQYDTRESGYFPREGLVTLSLNLKIQAGETYGLYIHLPDLPRILSGSTTIVHSVKILDPSPLPGREVTILPDQGYNLRWSSSAKYAVYQSFIKLNYLEGDSIFYSTKTLVLPRPLAFVNEETQMVTSYINGASFFKQILESLSPPGEGIRRKVIGFDVELFSGGEELALITRFDDNFYQSFFGLNDFTNIDGAIGVFSSISSSASYNNRLSDFTIDYLATSDSTKALGFLKHDQEFLP